MLHLNGLCLLWAYRAALECVMITKRLRLYSKTTLNLWSIDDVAWSWAAVIAFELAAAISNLVSITSHLAAIVYYRCRHLRVRATLLMGTHGQRVFLRLICVLP
jgi:hypothetical protein